LEVAGVAVATSAPTAVVRRQATRRRSGFERTAGGFYRVMRANPLTFVGFILVTLILVLALVVRVVPGLIVPYGADQNTGVYREAPTLFNWPPSSASFSHPFGTDQGGRDIMAAVVLALPLDLEIGVGIAFFALVVGGALGLIAGFWDTPRTVGGTVSAVILRTTDVFLAFPSLILALAIVASIGRGILPAILAIMITWWPYYVRLVRGETLAVKHLPYVTAARAAGVKDTKILTRHILRNVLEPVVVYFTLDIGTVLVTFSTISFIGAGIPWPGPTPEWGSMMSYYQGNFPLNQYWWYITFPAIAIFVTALAFSLLGDGLRDVLDPRTRRALAETSTHEPPAEETLTAVTPTTPSQEEAVEVADPT
jgi:peptide/nickel transport system permease protein